MTEEPKTRGRPTDYNPDFCEQVIALGKLGKSYTQIAGSLDVTRETLYEWRDRYPDFSYALTRARQYAQVWWEDQGQNGLEKSVFQASLWAKQVSCRFPADYREQKDVNLGGQAGNPVDQKVTIEFVGSKNTNT